MSFDGRAMLGECQRRGTSGAREVEEIHAPVASDDVLACHDELSPGEPIRSRHEAIAFYR